MQSRLVSTSLKMRAGKAPVVALVPAVVDSQHVVKVKVVPLIAVMPPFLAPDGLTLISPAVYILSPVLTKDGKIVTPIVAVLITLCDSENTSKSNSRNYSQKRNSLTNSMKSRSSSQQMI